MPKRAGFVRVGKLRTFDGGVAGVKKDKSKPPSVVEEDSSSPGSGSRGHEVVDPYSLPDKEDAERRA